jgi:hypothetical protein
MRKLLLLAGFCVMAGLMSGAVVAPGSQPWPKSDAVPR